MFNPYTVIPDSKRAIYGVLSWVTLIAVWSIASSGAMSVPAKSFDCAAVGFVELYDYAFLEYQRASMSHVEFPAKIPTLPASDHQWLSDQ